MSMIKMDDVLETINMIRQENLDIRTITMGISLFDCVSEDENRLLTNIYDKITKKEEDCLWRYLPWKRENADGESRLR